MKKPAKTAPANKRSSKKTQAALPSREQIERYYKRATSIHEAGHLTVALALGRRSTALLWKASLAPNTRSISIPWLGGVEIAPHFSKARSLVRSRIPLLHRAIIGIAGSVADCIDYGQCHGREVDTDYVQFILGNTTIYPSRSDLKGLKRYDLREAITLALILLKEHDDFFCWAALELYEREVVTDGQAWDKFHDPKRACRKMTRRRARILKDALLS
jgi:hypothetical protein